MTQIKTLQWKEVQYSDRHCHLPVGRWGHKLIAIDSNKLLTFGGFGGESSQGHYLDDVWVFDGNTFKWEEWHCSGPAPSKRSNYSLHYIEVNQEVLLFGGGSANRQRFADVWILSLKNKRWRRVDFGVESEAPWQRTYHVSEFRYPYLIVHGGEAVANLDLEDTWVLHLPTKKWQKLQIKGQTPTARRFHASVLHQNWLYIFGGCHQNYSLLDDIHRLDLSALFDSQNIFQDACFEWEEVKTGDLLSRWGQSCILFEGKVYIWGGRVSATKDANDLLVFDPVDCSLKQLITEGNAPSARRRHSAVVVGKSMLIFGGYSGNYFNDFCFITLPSQSLASHIDYTFNVYPIKQMASLLEKHQERQAGVTLKVIQNSSEHITLRVSQKVLSSNEFLQFLVGSKKHSTLQLPSFTSVMCFRSILYALETRSFLVPEQTTLHQKINIVRSLEYFGCEELMTGMEQHMLRSPQTALQPELLIELTQDLPLAQLRQAAAVGLLLKQKNTPVKDSSSSQSSTSLNSPKHSRQYVEKVQRVLSFEIHQKAMHRNSSGILRRTASKVKSMIVGEETPQEQEQEGCWRRMLRGMFELCGGRTKSE